jgi:hypothetical protein
MHYDTLREVSPEEQEPHMQDVGRGDSRARQIAYCWAAIGQPDTMLELHVTRSNK